MDGVKAFVAGGGSGDGDETWERSDVASELAGAGSRPLLPQKECAPEAVVGARGFGSPRRMRISRRETHH